MMRMARSERYAARIAVPMTQKLISAKELKTILQTLERQGTKLSSHGDAVAETTKAELLSPSFQELIQLLRLDVSLLFHMSSFT